MFPASPAPAFNPIPAAPIIWLNFAALKEPFASIEATAAPVTASLWSCDIAPDSARPLENELAFCAICEFPALTERPISSARSNLCCSVCPLVIECPNVSVY